MIFVPKTFKETGTEIPVEYHSIFDKFVHNIVGGSTILRSALGTWVSPEGDLVTERMIPVLIGCEDNQILRILTFAKTHYNQDAIGYVTMGGFGVFDEGCHKQALYEERYKE